MSQLEYDQVWVERSSRTLVRDVTLRLEPGELIALVGPNGSGKTTLLRAALDLVRPTRGRVLLGGQDVRRLPPRERAARIAWLPQILVANEPLAVHEAVATSRYRFGESLARSREAAEQALVRVGAAHLAERSILALSGGERQRVALAAVLAQESPIVLLDEPANHLDPTQQLATYSLIGELWQAGLGILLVTHDVNLLAGLPLQDQVRVVGLKEGSVTLEAGLSDPTLDERLSALFNMTMKALEHDGRRVIVPWPRFEETSTAPPNAALDPSKTTPAPPNAALDPSKTSTPRSGGAR